MAEGLAYYGADGGVVLPFREHFRSRWPGPTQCVVTDVDSVVRIYGPDRGGEIGRFLLLEWKHGDRLATGGQWHTFRLMDELMRAGDPSGERYCGMYLVNHVNEPEFKIIRVREWRNRIELLNPSLDEFDAFLARQLGMP